MVADANQKVKAEVEITLKQRGLDWFDAHPRIGWYVAVLSTFNALLNVLELLVK
jgi:hypothetical protein